MGRKLNGVVFHLLILLSAVSTTFNFDFELPEDRWSFRNARRREDEDANCLKIKPTTKDIVRRFYAILPYFDKEHANAAFLHKFRGTVYGMSEGNDILDREAAFYAAILAPMVFMQQYRDTWCLLERLSQFAFEGRRSGNKLCSVFCPNEEEFHRAMRLYQISHPTEKRSALKILQNLRGVNVKIRSFINDLSGASVSPYSTTTPNSDEELSHEKKDVRFLKELIKNLG